MQITLSLRNIVFSLSLIVHCIYLLQYFHPSTPYNSSFPTTRTPSWFNHHSRGHSVTIDIPPNLYDDCNWLGLALYASFSIHWDREKSVSSINSSHFLYCRFQTSNAGLDDQILVCRTTDEENNWLLGRYGLIWISYIPGEAFKDMLHQGGCIEASFVSNWPGVTVLKCGLRLLYQHDQVQFEQELKHCNAFISALRDFKRRFSLQEVYQVMKNCDTILMDENYRLVRNYEYLLQRHHQPSLPIYVLICDSPYFYLFYRTLMGAQNFLLVLPQ